MGKIEYKTIRHHWELAKLVQAWQRKAGRTTERHPRNRPAKDETPQKRLQIKTRNKMAKRLICLQCIILFSHLSVLVPNTEHNVRICMGRVSDAIAIDCNSLNFSPFYARTRTIFKPFQARIPSAVFARFLFHFQFWACAYDVPFENIVSQHKQLMARRPLMRHLPRVSSWDSHRRVSQTKSSIWNLWPRG